MLTDKQKERARTEECKPVQVTLDVDIAADVDWHPFWSERRIDRLRSIAKERCDELNATVKGVTFRVVEKKATVCSICEREWEVMPADEDCDYDACAYCGAKIAQEPK